MTELIIKYYGDIAAAVAGIGGKAEILSPTIAIVEIDADKLNQLENLKEVEYIEQPAGLSLNMLESLFHACITPSTTRDLNGEGVIVALIDSGIDYTHPDFRKDDGTTRIKYLWDMTREGAPPQGFVHGHLYTEANINAALAAPNPFEIIPQNDTIGHGTAVAGVAAGNGRASSGREAGVAPNAAIVAVKLGRGGAVANARTIELMRGLKFVADTADALDMPCAINISFGTNRGAHDGSSLFEQFVTDTTQRRRMSVVVAAGNEGAAGHHFSGNLRTGASETIEFTVAGGVTNIYLVIWKDFVDEFEAELITPNRISSGVVRYIDVSKRIMLDGNDVLITMGRPTHYNPYQMVFIDIRGVTTGLWKLVVTSVASVAGNYHIWMPTAEEVTRATAFTRPNPNATVTMPATAGGVIAVGATNAMLDTYAEFSGRGFADGRIPLKPDIVAPGVGVLAARAGGGYDTYSGTSIAAPFVTGAAALLMDWGIVQGNDADLYGQRLRAYLHRGAARSRERTYPNDQWGYGVLCLSETLRQLTLGR